MRWLVVFYFSSVAVLVLSLCQAARERNGANGCASGHQPDEALSPAGSPTYSGSRSTELRESRPPAGAQHP